MRETPGKFIFRSSGPLKDSSNCVISIHNRAVAADFLITFNSPLTFYYIIFNLVAIFKTNIHCREY